MQYGRVDAYSNNHIAFGNNAIIIIALTVASGGPRFRKIDRRVFRIYAVPWARAYETVGYKRGWETHKSQTSCSVGSTSVAQCRFAN